MTDGLRGPVAPPDAPRPLPGELDPRRGQRSRPRRAARMMSWVATVMSAVILLGSASLYALYLHYNGNIKRVGLGVNDSVAAPTDGSQNYLLVGDDSRTGATPQQLQEAHTTLDGGGVNTDVMMVAHLSPRDGKVTFISFPRDSWVDIPGHGYNKLNAAYAEGGAPLLVQTIEQLSGLHISHLVMVNFFGFMAISDAVGGVRVCLPQAAHDSYSGLYLSAGYHVIKGPTALAFVRQRHGLARGDLDRIQRQQEFIGAVIRKAESSQVLLNPFRLNSLLTAVTQSLTVDRGLTLDDMRTLALRLRHLDPAHVQFLTVPVANPNAFTPAGESIVELDYTRMAALFANIRRNLPPYYTPPARSSGPSGAALTVPPGQISVQVDNATSVTGLAHKAASELAAVGFGIASVGNAASQSATTVVRYGSGRAQSAQTLAAAVPGATAVADPSLPASSVVLDLGANFSRVQEVTVPASGAASPAPSAGSQAPLPATAYLQTPTSAAKDPCAV